MPFASGRTAEKFLSTPSVWRATEVFGTGGSMLVFLSTPSVWRATRVWSLPSTAIRISIHALRVEGDTRKTPTKAQPTYFYPRPPCGGRPCLCGFLSPSHDFYPRPPCGGRPWNRTMSVPASLFLSTPSVWRATLRWCGMGMERTISIHALRVEGDDSLARPSPVLYPFLSTPSVWRATTSPSMLPPAWMYFYPRPPCGGRLTALKPFVWAMQFLSTPSVWRATFFRRRDVPP